MLLYRWYRYQLYQGKESHELPMIISTSCDDLLFKIIFKRLQSCEIFHTTEKENCL